MSVIISNLTGGHHDNPNCYEVCINDDRITLFDHTPSDGLAQCLRQATEAVGCAMLAASPLGEPK